MATCTSARSAWDLAVLPAAWHCGFYPGSNPGDATDGTATSFEAARARAHGPCSSRSAPRPIFSNIDATERPMLGNTWEARCKLPTKPRCFLWHRYPDRGYKHIYTAHMSPNRPIIFCRGHEAIGCDRTDSVLWLFPAATLKSGADPSECSPVSTTKRSRLKARSRNTFARDER